MSSTNSKWELGVAVFHDSFEEYDQVTRLGAAYATPSSISGVSLSLDTSIDSDYSGAPFYVYGTLDGEGSEIPGADLIIGPSSDSTFDGSVEPAVAASVSGGTVTLENGMSWTSIVPPYSDYAQYDPVIIRTIPDGWSSGLADPGGGDFGFRPISRYNDAFSLTRYASVPNAAEVATAGARRYFNQRGVRLLTDNMTESYDRYIYKISKVNSMSPRIRRYRSSWYHRIVKANVGHANPLYAECGLWIKACDASGDLLEKITGEETGDTLTGILASYSTPVDPVKTDWTFDSTKFSLYPATDQSGVPGSGQIAFLVAGSYDSMAYHAANRWNRVRLEVHLKRGSNAAFDLDDLIIEHAHGTSKEADGYCEIDDFPSQGSIDCKLREGNTSSNYTTDNELKISQSFGGTKPKWQVSAQFNNVSTVTLMDFLTLQEWHKRGKLIAFRPFHPGLPNVMVGRIKIAQINNELPTLDRHSFSFQFEEA